MNILHTYIEGNDNLSRIFIVDALIRRVQALQDICLRNGGWWSTWKPGKKLDLAREGSTDHGTAFLKWRDWLRGPVFGPITHKKVPNDFGSGMAYSMSPFPSERGLISCSTSSQDFFAKVPGRSIHDSELVKWRQNSSRTKLRALKLAIGIVQGNLCGC